MVFQDIYDEIFETISDYMAIPIYIGNYHFTVGGILEILLFTAIIAIIFKVLLDRV